VAAGRVVFADWVGRPVEVRTVHGEWPEYGVLEDVSDWGVVLRTRRTIAWGPTDEFGTSENQEDRQVADFRPWHMVVSVRVLEPEEAAYHGWN
jgi:hypothetical protein